MSLRILTDSAGITKYLPIQGAKPEINNPKIQTIINTTTYINSLNSYIDEWRYIKQSLKQLQDIESKNGKNPMYQVTFLINDEVKNLMNAIENYLQRVPGPPTSTESNPPPANLPQKGGKRRTKRRRRIMKKRKSNRRRR
jgi:hypothetical protein